MDLVALLEDAARELPVGDHSIGLNAIVRHVKAAIRHLHRDQQHDPDTCTDAIYRMNQAYEGSLKEAYRVLAGKDPSGLSPFQIENYLENNQVVRPRVLTQLTRYRQDYRNPSTHDYKLDFDEDEALLAIVSVCGFAKLLFNQIRSKLASEQAQAKATRKVSKSPRATLKSRATDIGSVCLAYTNESSQVGWFEYERGLAESLKASGFDAHVDMEVDAKEPWDVAVKKGKSIFGIDARISRHTKQAGELPFTEHYPAFINMKTNFVGWLVIIRSPDRKGFHLYKATKLAKPFLVICEDDEIQLDALRKDLGELELIE